MYQYLLGKVSTSIYILNNEGKELYQYLLGKVSTFFIIEAILFGYRINIY